MLRWSMQLHKWIALVVAIQVLGWVAGGLIMTAIPIELVRGENHIATATLAPVDMKRLLPLPPLGAVAAGKGAPQVAIDRHSARAAERRWR